MNLVIELDTEGRIWVSGFDGTDPEEAWLQGADDTPDEANRLASVCEKHQERLIVWTLLDTGLRVSELAGLTREHIDWQNHRLMIYGKGGIYGTKSKRRIIPLTDRIRPLIDGHFAIHDTIGMTPRTIQRILKRLANKARINRPYPRMCSDT